RNACFKTCYEFLFLSFQFLSCFPHFSPSIRKMSGGQFVFVAISACQTPTQLLCTTGRFSLSCPTIASLLAGSSIRHCMLDQLRDCRSCTFNCIEQVRQQNAVTIII